MDNQETLEQDIKKLVKDLEPLILQMKIINDHAVIVSLFSAESLVDVESCERSMKGVAKLIEELPTSKYKDDSRLKKVLKRDLEALKTQQQTN